MDKPKKLNLPKCLTISKDKLEIYAMQELGLSLHGLGLDYDAIEHRCLEVERAMREQERSDRERGIWKLQLIVAIGSALSAAAAWSAVLSGK